MPWHVEKRGDKFAIIRSDTGKVEGYSDTKEKAERSIGYRVAGTTGEKMAGKKKS